MKIQSTLRSPVCEVTDSHHPVSGYTLAAHTLSQAAAFKGREGRSMSMLNHLLACLNPWIPFSEPQNRNSTEKLSLRLEMWRRSYEHLLIFPRVQVLSTELTPNTSQTSVSLAPGNPVPSFGLCMYCTYVHKPTWICIKSSF